jgi:hypothetical protein
MGGPDDIAEAETILRSVMTTLEGQHQDEVAETIIDCGTFLGKILQLQGKVNRLLCPFHQDVCFRQAG